MSSESVRLVYAANRAIGLRGLDLLRKQGIDPVALLLPDGPKASQTRELKAAASGIPIFEGVGFREQAGLEWLAAQKPDYILSVHYPYLFTREVLALPQIGILNLHPALLPYNRGWHTPTWAILEGTPIGATLHWVDEGLDSGHLAFQREVVVRAEDTAHSLYQRLLAAELDLLADALPSIKQNTVPRKPQPAGGSLHRKADLRTRQSLDEHPSGREIIRQLRALTTNNINEAAYITVNGKRYRVQVTISPEIALSGPSLNGLTQE